MSNSSHGMATIPHKKQNQITRKHTDTKLLRSQQKLHGLYLSTNTVKYARLSNNNATNLCMYIRMSITSMKLYTPTAHSTHTRCLRCVLAITGWIFVADWLQDRTLSVVPAVTSELCCLPANPLPHSSTTLTPPEAWAGFLSPQVGTLRYT